MSSEKLSAINFGELKPSKELTLGTDHWFLFTPKETGITLLGMEDLVTGTVLTTGLIDPTIRGASHKAWAGARHSRAPGTPWKIMNEMVEKGVDADQKMKEMFLGFGHASVGDMARLQVDLTNIPMHLCFGIFGLSAVNSGQEKSTRYQGDFSKTKVHGIENYLPDNVDSRTMAEVQKNYQELGDKSLEIYARQRALISDGFIKFYKPEDKKEMSSLNSRVLDCVRSALLFGNVSGMSFESSARDFSRVIGNLKGSPLGFYQRVGSQLERFLAPDTDIEEQLGIKSEAPGLIRHTDPQTLVNKNLADLKVFLEDKTDLLDTVRVNVGMSEFSRQSVEIIRDSDLSVGEKVFTQYILSLWPGMNTEELDDWIKKLPVTALMQISALIYNGHNNYQEIPELARTSALTIHAETSIGETRDLNRHRALGRFTTLPTVFGGSISSDTVYQILGKGFSLPNYLIDIDQFRNLGKGFQSDLESYYRNLYSFVGLMERKFGDSIDYSFIINLLPLGHKVDLFLHGDPKQLLYFTHQRSRNGGHINYRELAYKSNQLITDSDPSLAGFRLSKKPDPANREEFFDRS